MVWAIKTWGIEMQKSHAVETGDSGCTEPRTCEPQALAATRETGEERRSVGKSGCDYSSTPEVLVGSPFCRARPLQPRAYNLREQPRGVKRLASRASLFALASASSFPFMVLR